MSELRQCCRYQVVVSWILCSIMLSYHQYINEISYSRILSTLECCCARINAFISSFDWAVCTCGNKYWILTILYILEIAQTKSYLLVLLKAMIRRNALHISVRVEFSFFEFGCQGFFLSFFVWFGMSLFKSIEISALVVMC